MIIIWLFPHVYLVNDAKLFFKKNNILKILLLLLFNSLDVTLINLMLGFS